MIVADTSAIVAVAFGEPEREAFVQALHSAERVLISTVSVVEARMVVHGRRGQRAVVLVDDLLLVKVRSLPLLYKGSDFSETDIASAVTH